VACGDCDVCDGVDWGLEKVALPDPAFPCDTEPELPEVPELVELPDVLELPELFELLESSEPEDVTADALLVCPGASWATTTTSVPAAPTAPAATQRVVRRMFDMARSRSA
jgi:hypothetical protein